MEYSGLFQFAEGWRVADLSLYHHHRLQLICLHVVHPDYMYKSLTHLLLFCLLGICLYV